MRRFLLVALVEGTSDLSFFPDVLRAIVDDALGKRRLERQVDVRIELLANGQIPRGRWVVERVSEVHVEADVVAVHFDASANQARERRKSFEPVEREWSARQVSTAALVPLSPVREMEAWALADLEVIEGVLGVALDRSRVHQGSRLERPETLSDPKRTLTEVLAQARRPRRRARSTTSFLPAISQSLPLESLRRLPSFTHLEHEVHVALEAAHTRDE